MKLGLPRNTLVIMVKRGGRYFIPDGTTTLFDGDKLYVISDRESDRNRRAKSSAFPTTPWATAFSPRFRSSVRRKYSVPAPADCVSSACGKSAGFSAFRPPQFLPPRSFAQSARDGGCFCRVVSFFLCICLFFFANIFFDKQKAKHGKFSKNIFDRGSCGGRGVGFVRRGEDIFVPFVHARICGNETLCRRGGRHRRVSARQHDKLARRQIQPVPQHLDLVRRIPFRSSRQTVRRHSCGQSPTQNSSAL